MRINLWFIVLVAVGISLANDIYFQATKVATIPYSKFIELVKKDRIEKVFVSDRSISGSIKNPENNEKSNFLTVRIDSDIVQLLKNNNVEITGVVENTLLRDILSWILPAVFFVGIWILAMRYMAKRGGGMGGSFMSVGKSKAKVYVETDTKKSFADVAGADEAKAELEEVIHFLKEPNHFTKMGARLPKGILLVGPPGTGKTLLARAVAGEAKAPFFSISGSEFVEMFVGVGAARVRDLFEQARKKSPCIIFIDELDALGKARGNHPGSHDEKEQTLNQLLVELDGFDASSGIVILAATNRPEILDPALLRAGRFDRQVLVDKPDKTGRIAILQVHLKKLNFVDPNLNLETIAAITTGFSGADIENLVNEAALVATRRNAKLVILEDFNAAVERIVAGLERKNRVLNEQERRIVAYHEMGHAIVGKAVNSLDKLHKVSIIPRGVGALGYTMQRPTEDRFLMTKEELKAKIMVLLGGRAAEQIKFNHLSTGAADDITKATNIARNMVTKYGMADSIGFIDLGRSSSNFLGEEYQPKNYSEETAKAIDTAISNILSECYDAAMAIITDHRETLENSSLALLDKETLAEEDLDTLLGNVTNALSKS